MKYVIGLTGTIASGKSTTARILASWGAHTLDADDVAHQVMMPGMPAYQPVVAYFGTGITMPDGSIDRRALGAIVFSDPHALAELEKRTHPAVIAYLEQWCSGIEQGVVVIEAIKLLEAGIHMRCDAVWVVSCTRAQQEIRLRARNLDAEQIRQRIAAQPPLYLKLCAAHVIIDNSRDLADLHQQLQYAWQHIPGNAAEPAENPGPRGGRGTIR